MNKRIIVFLAISVSIAPLASAATTDDWTKQNTTDSTGPDYSAQQAADSQNASAQMVEQMNAMAAFPPPPVAFVGAPIPMPVPMPSPKPAANPAPAAPSPVEAAPAPVIAVPPLAAPQPENLYPTADALGPINDMPPLTTTPPASFNPIAANPAPAAQPAGTNPPSPNPAPAAAPVSGPAAVTPPPPAPVPASAPVPAPAPTQTGTTPAAPLPSAIPPQPQLPAAPPESAPAYYGHSALDSFQLTYGQWSAVTGGTNGEPYRTSRMVTGTASDQSLRSSLMYTETVRYDASTSNWVLETAFGMINENYTTNDTTLSPLYNTVYEQTDQATYAIRYDALSVRYGNVTFSIELVSFTHKLHASGRDTQYDPNNSSLATDIDTYTQDDDWTLKLPAETVAHIYYIDLGGTRIGSGNYYSVAQRVKAAILGSLPSPTLFHGIPDGALEHEADLKGSSKSTHTHQQRQLSGAMRVTNQEASNEQYDLQQLLRAWQRGDLGAKYRADADVTYTYSLDPRLPSGSTAGPVYVSSTHTTGNDFEGNAYDFTLATMMSSTAPSAGLVFPSSFSGTIADYQGVTQSRINLSWAAVTRYSVGSLATSPVIATTRWEIVSADTGLSSWSMGVTRDPMPANMRFVVSSVLSRFSQTVMTAGAAFMGSMPLNYLSVELAQPGDPINFRSLP